tara:strand:+ start:244 stop:564 length:321 start_codon:yes stop_codon:yes gene_type:complete
MKWQIWVEPNHIYETDYPNGWSHDDVMRAASATYGGKVTNVNPAPVRASDDDSSSSGGGFELGGGASVWIGGFILFIALLPYLLPIGAIALVCWGLYKLVKWFISL